MKRLKEIQDPKSCLNKAYDQEMVFVLLARDAAAPVAIQAWINERIRLGKNTADDNQILDAYECILAMMSHRTLLDNIERDGFERLHGEAADRDGLTDHRQKPE